MKQLRHASPWSRRALGTGVLTFLTACASAADRSPEEMSRSQAAAKAGIHATIDSNGYATILDAPPAPFTPVRPGEPAPLTPQQVADNEQFQRVGEFQNRVRDEVQALVERLRRTEKDNFVSVYYENEGDPSVVFQFLRNGPETLRKYSANPRFFGKTVRWSKAELMSAADFMWKTFAADRVLQSTGIGKNEVEAQILLSREEFLALVKRKGVTIPEPVQLQFHAAPVVPLVAPPPPATSDPAVPARIAPLIRIFPRHDRPAGMVNAIQSRAKIVLKDGCFRAADHDDALVLFPFGAQLFVDSEGYLAFGNSEVPGYARVGERVSFGGSPNEMKIPELVEPIHAACGAGKVIKVEGLQSAAAESAQAAVSEEVQALRSLRESYGLTDDQAQRAFAWLEKREAAQPRQTMPDGTLSPPFPTALVISSPPRPVADASECPPGTKLSFGLCRTPEGHIRPLPEWLVMFLAQER